MKYFHNNNRVEWQHSWLTVSVQIDLTHHSTYLVKLSMTNKTSPQQSNLNKHSRTQETSYQHPFSKRHFFFLSYRGRVQSSRCSTLANAASSTINSALSSTSTTTTRLPYGEMTAAAINKKSHQFLFHC